MTVIIGVDPHKSTHTAVAIDRDERPLARVRLVADRCQVQRLLAWAEPLGTQRSWAVESAGGWASCWPSSSWRRVSTSLTCPRRWRRGCGCWARPRASKNDPNDALATAIAGCGIAGCGWCGSRTTPRWSGC
jgi:transposase